MKEIIDNIEEIIIESDDKIETYFSSDAYRDFYNSIKQYPLLSADENKELTLRAQNGDLIARDKVIKSNLRLVAVIAHGYKSQIVHMNILDVIQEGSLGLITSIDKFDPQKGAYSTNAYTWIKQAITRAISDKEKEIREPEYLKSIKRKYFKFIEEYNNFDLPIPEDEEICKKLNISLDTLNNIRENKSLVSLNQKINEEDSKTELENYVRYNDNEFDNLIDKIDRKRLLIVLKNVLSPLHYYIIYYRFFDEPKKTLKELAMRMNVTKERIRQLEEKALKKIKPYIIPESKTSKKVISELLENDDINVYNIKPVDISKIVLYLYMKDGLNDLEKKFMYELIFSKYKSKQLAFKLGLSDDEYDVLFNSIKQKISEVYKDMNKFKRFKNNLLKSYETDIFSIKIDESDKVIDYSNLQNIYSSLHFDEILDLFCEHEIILTEKEIKLLEKYFKIPVYKDVSKTFVEQEIYLLLFGFKEKKRFISSKILYETFKNNKNEFTDEQIMYLECCYFNPKDKQLFREKYPNSILFRSNTFLINKLERLYYNISCMFENSFNREKYLYVKEKYKNKLTEERIELLDLIYGVKGKQYSIKELAELYNENHLKIHDKVRDAREFCISLYYNVSASLNVNFSLYKPFVLNPKIEMSEERRKILKMFIIDNLDYTEIHEITGLSNYKISNVITDAIRNFDFYRYKILRVDDVLEEDIDGCFKYYENNFDDVERKIIYYKKVDLLSNEEIAKKLKLTNKYCVDTITRFNRFYFKYLIKDVKITKRDILKEINTHISESVIDETGKKVLSLFYGLKTKYNEQGIKLSSDEIKDVCGINKNGFFKKLYGSLNNIKAKKIGVLNKDLVYIGRDGLKKLLKDEHLPISRKEREIICYLFGLNNYPYKKIDDLPEIFGDSKNSIRRRYQRAILNIYKYINHEIEGIINYETDIEPRLKYFCASDRTFIEEYFKNGLTYKELAKKYVYSFDQIVSIITRLKFTLKDLIKDNVEKCFDFDFYRKEKNNPKLPFYGNRELAIKIFDLFFGENNIKRLPATEIVKELDNEYTTSTILKLIKDLMLSFCELQDGIETLNYFTIEEIEEYYNKNFKNMNITNQKMYENFLEKRKNSKRQSSSRSTINYSIVFDMLKDKYPDSFSLEKTNKEEVIRLIRKFNNMNGNVRNFLLYKFEIRERDLMKGKEIGAVYKLLSKLDKKRQLDKEEPLVLKKEKIIVE